MTTDHLTLTIVVDARPAQEALARLATQWAQFMERVLADPVARAAFERAQKQPLPIRGNRGFEYRRRTRTRTRSRR